MDRNLILAGFLVLVVGIVGASIAGAAAADATGRYAAECFPFGGGGDPVCMAHLNSMRTYGTISAVFQGIAVLGVAIVVVTLLLEVVRTTPAAPPAAPGPPCPTCGRPIRWIPEYARWYCDGCGKYV